jgi:hypothetical protein
MLYFRKLDCEDGKWVELDQICVRSGISSVDLYFFVTRGFVISENSVISCP